MAERPKISPDEMIKKLNKDYPLLSYKGWKSLDYSANVELDGQSGFIHRDEKYFSENINFENGNQFLAVLKYVPPDFKKAFLEKYEMDLPRFIRNKEQFTKLQMYSGNVDCFDIILKKLPLSYLVQQGFVTTPDELYTVISKAKGIKAIPGLNEKGKNIIKKFAQTLTKKELNKWKSEIKIWDKAIAPHLNEELTKSYKRSHGLIGFFVKLFTKEKPESENIPTIKKTME